MTTTENNILIAKFIGAKVTVIEGIETMYYPILDKTHKESKLKFHKDWNWLMQAVEKIESLPTTNEDNEDVFFNVTIGYFNECTIFDANDKVSIVCARNSKIEAVYYAVLEFIEWYNSAEKEN